MTLLRSPEKQDRPVQPTHQIIPRPKLSIWFAATSPKIGAQLGDRGHKSDSHVPYQTWPRSLTLRCPVSLVGPWHRWFLKYCRREPCGRTSPLTAWHTAWGRSPPPRHPPIRSRTGDRLGERPSAVAVSSIICRCRGGHLLDQCQHLIRTQARRLPQRQWALGVGAEAFEERHSRSPPSATRPRGTES